MDTENEIYDYVDGCSMTIYMIATLLEHELLISLANEIMHSHHAPTEEDVKVAHEFADHALKLALEGKLIFCIKMADTDLNFPQSLRKFLIIIFGGLLCQ
jgi:hypothetical protein